MTNEIVINIIDFFENKISKELIVFFISMLPILELRGSILAAGLLKMNFLSTYIIAIIGNMLPIPFIFLFIDKIFLWLKKTKFKNIVEKIENKALSKSDNIKKYGKLGLLLFVAIPLPGTGAWTGSLISILLRMKMKDCIPYIFLGVIIAGLIMSLLAFGIIKPII